MVIFIIIIILPHAWFNLITLSFGSHVEIFLLYVIYCEFDQENCQTSIAFPFVFLPHIFCIACYLYSKSYDANIINNNFNIFYLHWNFILTHISLKFYLIWHFLLENFYASLLLFSKENGNGRAIISENKCKCHIPSMATVVILFILGRTVCCTISNTIIFTIRHLNDFQRNCELTKKMVKLPLHFLMHSFHTYSLLLNIETFQPFFKRGWIFYLTVYLMIYLQ